VARQEGMIRYGIQQVKDVGTLQLVADVSQQDYPDMSDAASVKIDIQSIATNQKLAIESWADDVAGVTDGVTDIESMTITELKYELRLATTHAPVTTESLNSIVLEYLQTRGYERSAAGLLADSASESEGKSVSSIPSSEPIAPSERLAPMEPSQGRGSNGHRYDTRQSKKPKTTSLAQTRRWRP